MELRNIISFQKICELNSFSKAATELGYSQSTVTMQMKQLENELAVSLFDRIGKTVRLTDDGYKFLSYAVDIIRTANNAKQALNKDAVPKGELRIGLLESVCTSYLPGILKQFHTEYPGVSTVIKIGTDREIEAMLSSNSIDLLWTFDLPIENAEWTKVYSYRKDICVIVSPEHRLAGSPNINLKDIKDETYILTEKNCSYRTIFEKQLSKVRFNPNIFLEIGNTEIIKRFVTANLGITVLPEFAVAEELRNRKVVRLYLEDFGLEMEGQIFIHKNKWLTSGINAFIETIKNTGLL